MLQHSIIHFSKAYLQDLKLFFISITFPLNAYSIFKRKKTTNKFLEEKLVLCKNFNTLLKFYFTVIGRKKKFITLSNSVAINR